MSAKSRKAKEAKWGPGMKRCGQCHEILPLARFLWNGARGHFRVTICNDCAAANIRLYNRTQMVGRMPEEFSERED